MGKQINYWLEYEGFLKIAETALKKGCIILKEQNGKVFFGNDISIITPDCFCYYFHFPPAGEVKTLIYDSGRELVDSGYTPSGNTVIEAGFSRISNVDKTIIRARLFIISGYYDENGEWIPRSDGITKLYSSLERVAKKLAPPIVSYVENTNPYAKKNIYKYVDYISPFCAQLAETENYQLKQF